MGCFLGCFGISTKRKRRKPANRILPGDSKHVSYEPLDSSVSKYLDIPENTISSNSQLSYKPKERLSVKVRKKVRFNLNVQTYEPIPDEETTTYQFLQSVEEEESEKNRADVGKENLPSLSDGKSNLLQLGSYPTNYRYQNFRESYDEEDEMAYEEIDLEDNDFFSDYDDEDEIDDGGQRQTEEFLDQFDSDLNMISEPANSLIQLNEGIVKNEMTLSASTDGELNSAGCGNTRTRSQYLCSVLNPVENTSQWKEIKARAAAPQAHRRKENNPSKPLLQDIAVDASLSNWLNSPNTEESKITGSTKNCNIAFDTLSLKNNTYDSSFPWRSREDRVILDITNLEAL